MIRGLLVILATLSSMTAVSRTSRYQGDLVGDVIQKGGTKVVILDLDGVLFGDNKLRTVRAIGPWAIPAYLFNQLPLGRSELFEFLRRYEGNQKEQQMSDQNRGLQMPMIMEAWQLGQLSREQIDGLHMQIKSDPKLHDLTKKAMFGILDMMFTPTKFVTTRSPMSAGRSLLKHVVQLKETGLIDRVVVGTNWDLSIDLLITRYPEIFDFVDAVYASAHMKLMKPQPEFFRHIMKQEGFDFSQGLLIDDDRSNRESAKDLGMQVLDPVQLGITR